MKKIYLLSLLSILCLCANAQGNYLANGDLEDSGRFKLATSQYAVGEVGLWTFTRYKLNTEITGPPAQISSIELSSVDAFSGSKSVKLNCVKQIARKDLFLIQQIPNVPSGIFKVSVAVRAEAANNIPVSIELAKSTTPNSGNIMDLAQMVEANGHWQKLEVEFDLTSWSDVERNNMRIYIRPNCIDKNVAPNAGNTPYTFYIDDISFELSDVVVEKSLKSVAIDVLNERIKLAQNAGFAEEASALKIDLAVLKNVEFDDIKIPDYGVGFFPKVQIAANNPFITAMENWAEAELKKPLTSYAKADETKKIHALPEGTNSGGSRNLGWAVERMYWLLVASESKYRGNLDLFQQFLRTIYAVSDEYYEFGGKHLNIPGSTASAFDDWFAAGPMVYSWAMSEYSFGDLMSATFKGKMQTGADRMGNILRPAAQAGIEESVYCNRDAAYAEILSQLGVYRNNQEWIDYAKKVVDITIEKSLYPDGAYSYSGVQNECPTYHGGNNNSLAKVYAMIKYQPARDCIAQTANWEILSNEPGDVAEYYTSPTWKTQWNGSSGWSGEMLVGISKNAYQRTYTDQCYRIYGYPANPMFASYYSPEIEGKPIPNNYVVYDRNIQGPRARYNNYSYAISTRNTIKDETIKKMGMQTFVGSMFTTDENSTNGQRKVSASLMAVHPKVHVKKSYTQTEWGDWAYTASNVNPTVSVARETSAMSVFHDLQTQWVGPVSFESEWGGFQQWITMPDRMIGLVEVFPKPDGNRKAWEVDGRVRFTFGRSNVAESQNLEIVTPGKEYTYGDYRLIVHSHDFQIVDTCTAGVVRDDAPHNAKEVRFRYDLSGGVNNPQYIYPADFRKFFVVEVRLKSATENISVQRIVQDQYRGLIVRKGGTSYSVWRNITENDIRVKFPKDLLLKLNTEYYYNRTDDDVTKKPTVVEKLFGTFNIPSNGQLFSISSNARFNKGRGWNNYDELLDENNIFPQDENPNLDIVDKIKDRIFNCLVNKGYLTVTGEYDGICQIYRLDGFPVCTKNLKKSEQWSYYLNRGNYIIKYKANNSDKVESKVVAVN